MVFSQATGALTDDDLFEHQRTLRADEAFDPGYHQLWDLRGVTEMRVSASTVRTLAEARSFRPGVRRAIVAGDDVGYGLSRMFQTLHEQSEEDVRIFRELTEARRWLDLDPDPEAD